MADGPRALRAGEWDQLDRVVSTVFRPEMFHDYPQLFNEDNRDNLRVVAEDGNVVCHVGMTERRASLAGCGIDVACIGAVSTLDEYRGRGFASQAFQDACTKAAGDGIDVMLISGGRGLYTRVGCREVGRDAVFTITRDAISSFKDVSDKDVSNRAIPNAEGAERYVLAQVSAQQIDGLRALYQREAVRFLRPLEDWEMAFDCGIVMNTASDFWGLSAGGALLAYIVVHQPDKVRQRGPDAPTTLRVVEFAGERTAVVAALPRLLEHYGTDRLTIHVQGTDPALHAYLAGGVTPGKPASGASGLTPQPASASGTLRVINFPQLMERCRPLLAERLGTKGAAELAFEADAGPGSAEGGFTIRRGEE
ncbi:MAG: GNAT family N-acetyltransferase, partial [Chloroflexota bacterium]|nr:GNAT family N-acetyltransferase [Chloroflexota bacterium]